MADLLSDADVGFKAAPTLLSDADVGFKPAPQPQPAQLPSGVGASSTPASAATPDIRGLIDKSRQMGASDDQIRGLMLKAPFLADTWQASEKAGISPDAVFQHFGIAAPQAGVMDTNTDPNATPPPTPTPTPTLDDFGRDVSQPASGQDAANTVAERVGRAIVSGWRETPDLLTPQAQDWLANAEKNNPRPNLQDVLTVGHAALAAGNAVFRGGLEGVAALGEAVGQPLLGRDVAGYYEAMGMTGAPHVPALLRSTLPETRAMLAERGLAVVKPSAEEAVAAIGAAPDLDSAIAAAGKAVAAPIEPAQAVATEGIAPPASAAEPLLPPSGAAEPAPAPITAAQVQRRDSVGYVEAARRADIENATNAAQQPGGSGTELTQVQREQAALAAMKSQANGAPPQAPGEAAASASPATEPQSVGAGASRDMTPPSQLEMAPAEFAASRLQGETERLAAPPKQNDPAVYIPGVQSTLAEVTGDPVAAMDQAYNRQQPEAMTQHIDRENKTADLVSDYYADTAGSAHDLLRMERARDDRAAANINQVFGAPDDIRPAADPEPIIDGIDNVLNHPRQQERDAVRNLLSNLRDRFFNDDGSMKTDPYSLYGIRDHIGDLLNGVGNTETSSAARVIQRELMQIRDGVDNAIEAAVPGFAKFRAEYASDSGQIAAAKMLQDARLSLLNKDQHITPAKWFTFMRGIVQGRADPFDPASALSEEQMDRLWNITDQMKRATFIDAGKPRGSWTSMMQQWGGRFAQVAAHSAAAYTFPVIGNVGVGMASAALRARSIRKEMGRVLNPDIGQPTAP